MADVDTKQSSNPPYLSYTTFKNKLRELAADPPARVDTSLLGSMSGSSQTLLLSSFRFFGLINDDGVPTPFFVELGTADDAAWPQVFRPIVEARYGAHLPLLPNGTPGQLKESFKMYPAAASVTEKSIRFFLTAAEEAGLTIGAPLRAIRGSSGGSSPKRARVKRGPRNTHAAPPPPPPSVQPLAAKSFRDALLEKFPAFDPTWDAEMQSKWFDGFQRFMQMQKEEANEE